MDHVKTHLINHITYIMNQELATLRANDYISNIAIIKSQKVLGSQTNFHLKTQQQEKNEEQRKSPEQGRAEFRETTWRKPRMPYKKFPDAFQMREKRNSINKAIDVEGMKGKEQESQQKKIKMLLNPISLGKEVKSKNEEDDSNPLRAFQKYIQLKNQFSEAAQKLQERDKSSKKYKTLSTKVGSSMFKISDCITLQVIKRGHNTGTLKKMLHVPTFQLVCVRQQPLNTKESRNSINQWVNFWESKLNREANSHFLKVYNMAFNYPEGAVSILTEYHEEGSLLDLLNTVMTLPESTIRSIFKDACEILREYYEITELQFGGLSPSQIIIANNGIKLGMGLYYHFSNINSNSIYHLKTPQKITNIFEMNMTQKNFMKSSITQPANLKAQRALDIFKLGLIILECAIGGFQNFEQSSIIHQTLKIIFTEEGQKIIERDNVCCLVHSQPYLLEWAFREEKIKKDQLDPSKVLFYNKIIKDRFSLHFTSFLCNCLRLSHAKRASIDEILNHSFLKAESKECRTVNVTLQDLLMIGRNQSDPMIQSVKQERLDKFLGHILQVLSNCSKDIVVNLLKNSKDRILNLGKYIGVSYLGLGEKLYDAMNELAKSLK